MPLIELKTIIYADIQTCFDLSRNIDFHKTSLEYSNEKAIAGKTSGLIGLGEWVTWEAKHLGITQQLTSKITQFNSPNCFTDQMVSGPFKSFKHEHIFESAFDNKYDVDYTLMTDKFCFKSPLGALGKLANVLFLNRYMTKLLVTRNRLLKQKAEEIAKSL